MCKIVSSRVLTATTRHYTGRFDTLPVKTKTNHLNHLFDTLNKIKLTKSYYILHQVLHLKQRSNRQIIIILHAQLCGECTILTSVSIVQNLFSARIFLTGATVATGLLDHLNKLSQTI